jgi:hypothetical protein
VCNGARRDRTVDLLNAIQALSQLSYSPGRIFASFYRFFPFAATADLWERLGLALMRSTASPPS